MKQTKKIAISAMLSALGIALLSIGAVIEIADLAIAMLVSLFVVLIYIEIGSPYTWLLWLCTSLGTALIFPAGVVWVEYLLVFGIYPLLKAFIERLPKHFWLPIKLVYINAVVWVLFFLFKLIFSVDLFGEERIYMRVFLYVLINVSFIAYDMFITVMTRLYFAKYRKLFHRFFK